MYKIDFENIQNTLSNVFSNNIKIPFVWEDDPRNCLQKPYGVLSILQSITLGKDYSSYTFRDSDVTLSLYGNRELIINIQIYSRHSRGEFSARSLIERARLSLAHPAVKEDLKKAGLIFVENHPAIDLNHSFDNRHESRASFDTVFRVLLQEQHLSHIQGYFEQVELKYVG